MKSLLVWLSNDKNMRPSDEKRKSGMDTERAASIPAGFLGQFGGGGALL
jgi:hypothetical protein